MTIQEKAYVIKDFLLYCKEFLNIDELPRIKLITDHNWVVSRRSFGEYRPAINTLFVYIGKRNLADILRTTSHELVHHKQNIEGRLFPGAGADGSEIENEANAFSGMIMRKYGKKNKLIYESKLVNILEMSKSPRFTIFCDMDGVLCDFDAQFEHYYGILPREYANQKGSQLMKKAVDDIGIKYWSEMPWFPGAKQLWDYISDYSPIILTSPSSFIHARAGKLQWISKNLDPKPQDIMFAQTGLKHEVLSDFDPKRSILIDDFYRNTAPWQDSGGIGITHKSADKTITILQKFGL
jgi:hypothetical protein